MLLESSCFKLSHAMCMCAGILCTCYQISNAGYFLIIGAVNIFNTINHCIQLLIGRQLKCGNI